MLINKWKECDECEYTCVNIAQERDKDTGLLLCNSCHMDMYGYFV